MIIDYVDKINLYPELQEYADIDVYKRQVSKQCSRNANRENFTERNLYPCKISWH